MFSYLVNNCAGTYFKLGCVLALLTLIGTLFVTTPEKKGRTIWSVIFSAAFIAVFGLSDMIINYYMPASGGKTAILFVIEVLSFAFAVFTVVMAFINIKGCQGKKTVVMYQIVRLFAAGFALLFMWFKALRQGDYFRYGDLVGDGKEYQYIVQVPGIKSNNIFMGLFLVMFAIGTLASLVVFLISVFKEDKHKFCELLTLVFATLLLIVPAYEIVVHVDAKLTAPESLSLSLLTLAFGASKGTGVNFVAIIGLLFYITYFVLKTVEAVCGRKNVIDYVKAGMIALLAVLVLMSNLFTGIALTGYAKDLVTAAWAFVNETSGGNLTNAPHILTSTIGKMSGLARLVAIITILSVVALVAKQIVYAIKESEFYETAKLNARVRKEGKVGDEKTFGAFFKRHVAMFSSVLILVIGAVLAVFLRQNMFLTGEPWPMIGSDSNAAGIAYILMPGSFGDPDLIPNYFFWAYLVLTAVSFVTLLAGDLANKKIVKYIGVIAGMLSGIALIVMQTSSGSMWVNKEYTEFTYTFNLPIVLFGLIVMVAAYFGTYKESIKLTRDFARIVVENIGVSMTVVSFIFVILYLERILI